MPRCSPRASPAFTLTPIPPLTSRCGSGGTEAEYRSPLRLPHPHRRAAYVMPTQPAQPARHPPLPLPQRRLQNCQVRGHSEAACNAVFVYKVGTSLSERLGARSLVPVPARAEPPSSEAAVRRQLPAALPRGFHNRRSPSRDHCRLSDSCSVPSPGIKHPLTVPSLVGRWAAGKNCKGGEECIN